MKWCEHPWPEVDEEEGRDEKYGAVKWGRGWERLDAALALGTVLEPCHHFCPLWLLRRPAAVAPAPMLVPTNPPPTTEKTKVRSR